MSRIRWTPPKTPFCPRPSRPGSPHGLGPASAPDRTGASGAGTRVGTAHRPDRCRQDARRLPAQPDRAFRTRETQARHSGAPPCPYALCLAAEGACGRHRAKPGASCRGDGASRHHRDAHGDTPTHKRQRQKQAPPDILLTTPEQIALLLSDPQGREMLSGIDTVILDELHALVTSKRGDLLALGLAALHRLSPGLRTIGLSATVANPDDLRAWLVPQPESGRNLAELVQVAGGATPTSPFSTRTNACPGRATPRAMRSPTSTGSSRRTA